MLRTDEILSIERSIFTETMVAPLRQCRQVIWRIGPGQTVIDIPNGSLSIVVRGAEGYRGQRIVNNVDGRGGTGGRSVRAFAHN